MTTLTPDAARVAARIQTYPNSQEEQAAIANIDEQVFERVRAYEQILADNAAVFHEEAAVHLQAADEIATALRREIRFSLDEGSVNAEGEAAERYNALRLMAESAIAALERADREAAWRIPGLQEPYEAFDALMAKWPLLRRVGV
jgi:hypothetical protein